MYYTLVGASSTGDKHAATRALSVPDFLDCMAPGASCMSDQRQNLHRVFADWGIGTI